FPGVGIDAEYVKTTQHEHQIQCQRCQSWHWLTWELAANREGVIGLWCPLCKGQIDRLTIWEQGRVKLVARNPDAPVVGFWMSKLVSPRVDLAEMWARSQSTKMADLLAFWNEDMGLPHEPEGARLTRDLIRACIDDHEMADTGTWSAMGVDVGYTLNYWIMEIMPDNRHKTLKIGTVENWTDLDILMKRYNVRVCVCDDGPELTADRQFARRHRGRVFLATYRKDMPGADWCTFDMKKQKVSIARATGITEAHENIENQVDSLPRTVELIDDFIQQMTVQVKVAVIEADGTTVYKYPKTGKADHYDHAKVYCEAAMVRLAKLRRPDAGGQGGAVPTSSGARKYRGRV
ncbi:MAG: hypothetical protein DRP52_06750, partial [Planctomycetota bacterium]